MSCGNRKIDNLDPYDVFYLKCSRAIKTDFVSPKLSNLGKYLSATSWQHLSTVSVTAMAMFNPVMEKYQLL